VNDKFTVAPWQASWSAASPSTIGRFWSAIEAPDGLSTHVWPAVTDPSITDGWTIVYHDGSHAGPADACWFVIDEIVIVTVLSAAGMVPGFVTLKLIG